MIYTLCQINIFKFITRLPYLVNSLFIFRPCLTGKLVCPASIISEDLAKQSVNKFGNIDGLAHALGLPQAQLLGVLVGQVCEFDHRITALLRRPLGPLSVERGASRRDCLIDILLGCYLNTIGNKALVMRTVDAQGFARCGVNVLIICQM